MPSDKSSSGEKIQFKNKLKSCGIALIQERVVAARLAMDEAQKAANSEEKSSAGDKYETGRAMGHLQKEMHTAQLAAAVQDMALMQAIPVDMLYRECVPGAVLQAGGLTYFISLGLGKQTIDGHTVLFLSPQAPLAKLLSGLGPGDTLSFNQRNILIEEVY
jgi:transcription elongation GreA/GreB family factor